MAARNTKEQELKPIGFERTRPANCFSPEIRKKARRLFAKGYGYKFVAKELGISQNTTRDWGRKFKKGEFTKEISLHLYRYGDEAKNNVWALHNRGMSLRAISMETGIPVSTCWKWISKRETVIVNGK